MELACPAPLPALLPRAPACSKDYFLEMALADFRPTLWVSGRDVMDVISHANPILHALDDGDDPHEVSEQLKRNYAWFPE